MIKLYIYKMIYNKNNRQINAFINNKILKKYKLDTYEGFNNFINREEIERLEQFTFDNNSSKVFKKLKEYEEKNFEEKITKDDIAQNGSFDDFYMASYKLILSKLNKEKFENDKSYINFYSNVCESFYKKDDEDYEENKLFSLMKFLFDKETYQGIKKEYNINSEDIDALLYGYRYCLNELKEEEGNYIYSYLYNKTNLRDFDQKFYPGSDNNKEESYYELYNQIIKHFKEKPNDGCYVCLCDKGYYHSVKSGFPGFSEINMKCPNCQNEIGAKDFYEKSVDEKGNQVYIKKYETVKNNSMYYRIFKDYEQIEDLKRMREFYSNFEKMNYMTVEEFKDQYIKPLYSKEKGLNKIDINNFKKENKIIRNLSQISYRLLNYILYCHLFFARLFTQSDRFDKYLPDGISWFTMIKECFNKLKVELKNKGIKNLKIFMNCVFKDLFNKLHNQECIDEFEDLIKFEDGLEKIIQEKCQKTKEEIENFKKLERDSIKDEKSAVALLKEIYDKSKYNK